jgi:hypothetical protein
MVIAPVPTQLDFFFNQPKSQISQREFQELLSRQTAAASLFLQEGGRRLVSRRSFPPVITPHGFP